MLGSSRVIAEGRGVCRNGDPMGQNAASPMTPGVLNPALKVGVVVLAIALAAVADAPARAPARQREKRKKCPKETICFKKVETPAPTTPRGPHNQIPTDVPNKFDKQLALQTMALNAKTPAQIVATFPGVPHGLRGAASRRAQRAEMAKYIAANQVSFVNRYGQAAWDEHIGNLQGIHRLDITVGGDPTDVYGAGDGAANVAIGRQWMAYEVIGTVPQAQKRRDKLRAYAERMAKERCPMQIILAVC